MAKGKRKCPDINSSSTADIAFLLLIFFLITTSMDTDRGLARRLPPPPENEQQKDNEDKVKQRNVLQVFLNMYDQLMVNGEVINVSQLRDKAKEFIANKANAENMPELVNKEVEFFGTVQVTEKHVISLQNDRSSSYQSYIDVQNELVAAYNELRDELATEKWGMKYEELDEDQQKAVREVYPQKISEAEPKKYGEKK
jgi:biopolymer transport protein ExbD